MDSDNFRDRLLSAMVWAGGLSTAAPDTARIGSCLRSDFLGRDAIAIFPAGLSSTVGASERAALCNLVEARRALLDLRNNVVDFTWQDAEAEMAAPRALLLFSPQSSLFDGAATPPTHGFLNANYFPSWDTWLDLLDELGGAPGPILVSWVPRWCRDLVDEGIAVDPARCLAWGAFVNGGIVCRGWGKTWAEGGPSGGTPYRSA